MDFRRFLVFTGLVVGALAGTIKQKQCSKACDSLDDEGMFRAFKSYYFSYALDIDSRVNGRDSAQSSTVRIEATAVIEGISACDKILKLSDINILEKRQDGIMVAPEAVSSFRDTLSAHPLRFSMKSNGTITSICPEAGEEIWALNVKRGFLSHIQTRGTTRLNVFEESGVFETGVTGVCMSVYRRTGELTFIKRNDYLTCKHRTNLNLFGDAIPLPPQGPPVSPLASRMECEYEMDSQTIRSIECRELYTVKPFSESESIPETMVHSVIRRIDVRPTINSAHGRRFARRTSLLYEDPVQVSQITSNDVRNTITHICESITDGITSETPLLFETLTKQLGELDTDHINDVVNGLQGICSRGETHEVVNMVKDALIDCDKEQCALGFHSLVQSENSAENEVYLRKWFMKLVFYKNPTKHMINLIKHYVSGSREVNLPAYYALSAMIHQYCRMSEENCSSDRDILNAAVIFEDNLHESCLPENEEDKKKILMSLRAIGNMGLIQSKSLLERCHRGENPNQIHVATIRAYRRSSCYAVPIGQFIRIFSNIDNDSELRIAAYRAIIRCPSFELLKSIANILSIELNDQVSCYVSSHLANIENSPDLMLADLQTAISQSRLANITKCAMDFRKFSNNYDFSYSDDESGNGIHFDSDVIFTAKSYLPRSARLAMNIDLFGYSLNLFELDARIEGWEEALEALMTPGEKDREANMIQKLKWKMSKLVGNVLNKMNTKYGSSRDLVGDVSEEATVAMKFLGNDVFYGDQNDFKSVVEMFSREKIMKKISSLATQRTGEYSHNKILKSSKVTVPTLTGMPLEISIQGAINTVWKASGKLDVMGILATPRRMAIQGFFEPSAAIEIHSDMMVDVYCARSGLSHKINLASSLSLGGSWSFKNGMFKVKINAPRRSETIINASSALYFMQRNEMVPVSEPEDAVITTEPTLSIPGYDLHISGRRPVLISLPEAFLHTWTMKVMLDKLEEGLVSYDFEAGLRTDTMFRTGETDHMHLLVGAPGSETIGVYSVDVVYHRRNKTLIVRTERPGESAFYMGSLRNEPNRKRLHLLRTVSGETFRLEVGMDKIPLTNGVKFIPVFVHSCPHFNVTLDGYVTYIGEKTTWNFTLVDHHIHIGRQDSVTEGNFIKNSTLELVTLTGRAHDINFALESGFRLEETPSSVVINPIFCYNLSDYNTRYYRVDGGPVVIWKEGGVTLLNKLFLDLTWHRRSSNSTRRLMEVSKLQMSKSGFSFQGKLQDDRPFRVEVDTANNEQYSVNITTQTSRGENNLRGLLFNVSSEDIYRLEIIEACDGTEEFKLTSEFKNEARALQYLETTMEHKGEQFYRRKTGLRTQILDTRTIRYTPIFIFEGFRRSVRTYMEGSVDVSENGFTINDLAFVDRRDIVRLSGSTLFGHDGKISSVTWSYDLDGTCMAEIGMYAGSVSYHENMVSFHTSVASDPSLNQTDFSLTFDLQNSTKEGDIFAWDGKVEFVVPPHPELNFRIDTEYNLTPKQSSGNIFRLCYSTTDCALTEKLVTLGHDLTFSLDRRNGLYSHDLEVTYTHPAAEQEINVEWTTSCVPEDVSSGNSSTHLTLKHQVGNHFTTAITPIADEESSNCTSNFLVTSPGYYEYGFTDNFLVSDETFDLNPFNFRYGWLC